MTGMQQLTKTEYSNQKTAALITVFLTVENTNLDHLDALESIHQQTLSNLNLTIVVEDSGEQTTGNIEQQLRQNWNSKFDNISITTKESIDSFSKLRELLAYKVTTPYVFFIDHLVRLYPNCLSRYLGPLETNSDALMASSYIEKVLASHDKTFIVQGNSGADSEDSNSQESLENITKLSLIHRERFLQATAKFDWTNTKELSAQIFWDLCDEQGFYRIDIPEILLKQFIGAEPDEPESNSVANATTSAQRDTVTTPSLFRNEPRKKPKIAVISWDLAHNPVGRAFLLADMAEQLGEVELIGAIHSNYGKELWPPLKNIETTIRSFAVHNFESFLIQAHNLAKTNQYAYVYVGKPRIPSLLLGFLIKHYSQCPLILDIDDHELSFFKNSDIPTFEELVGHSQQTEWRNLYSEIWTRFAENLIPHADTITVSNIALQKRYGGAIVRHARNEKYFDPSAVNRQAVRAEFGYSKADKVILFVGTPRPHKGIYQIAQVLETLNDPSIVLCIVGTIRDKRTSKEFEKYKNARIDFHDDQPWERLPEIVSIADLVCILQNPTSAISEYQIPAKLTDAIAMGIPVIVSNVPPLVDLIEQGCIISVDTDAELEKAIESSLGALQTNPNRNLDPGRLYFLKEFSYAVNIKRVKQSFDLAEDHHRAIPSVLYEVFRLLEREASIPIELPASKAAHRNVESLNPDIIESNLDNASIKGKIHADKPLNIVFFWKQNDSGIYGRRQDMLVKYLAQSNRIGKILHFDAPISARALQAKAQKGPLSSFSQENLVLLNTVQRFLEMKDELKVFKRTFVHDESGDSFMGFKLPKKSQYVEYVKKTIQELDMEFNCVGWVCPIVFDFPEIAQAIDFDFVISDIIDNQMKWDIKPQYRLRLEDSYRETLEHSNIAFSNCKTVRESFLSLNSNITIVQNGAEVLDKDRIPEKPQALKELTGPVIGYVGNLSDRVDMDLIEYVASQKHGWNIVIIGSIHGNSKIFKLNRFKNVHFLGVKPYKEALRFIKNFDVAMIPHVDNELTRSMNPLKLYVYYSAGIPIVTTAVDNIGELTDAIKVSDDYASFLQNLEASLLGKNVSEEENVKREKLLQTVSWQSRTSKIFDVIYENLETPCIAQANFGDRKTPIKSAASNQQLPAKPVQIQSNRVEREQHPIKITHHIMDNCYKGTCNICGTEQTFEKAHRSLREGYQCSVCKSSLRYRGQATAIINAFSQKSAKTLQELCEEPHFQEISIYEPGTIGPFRKHFATFDNYIQSFFWGDVRPGAYREGIQCQNLEKLTYESERFDLAITSDILEHVRRPFDAFSEIFRILNPGGYHIFSIPITLPGPSKSVYRVDTTGDEDVFLMEKRFHSAPSVDGKSRGKSLVYMDFGRDIVEQLDEIGFKTELLSPEERSDADVHRLITFVSRKPQ